MAKLKEIVIDADHPASLARFWERLVAGYAIRAYDAAEIERLRVRGLTPESDPVVMLDGPGPTLCFQQMKGPRPARNRVHLDLHSPARTQEVARLLGLGARLVRTEKDYTVLRDPEGNQFCITDRE
ncbi:hypothetical protein SAMN02745157_1021 [Kaistia soli DSM 19436]|uniref:Glyoxalase-like domain-containing protein n=1 Tax=Kaistia soli DSM 19436 TaxID=1122133 RepID=A0A1M4WNK8_9HYPH|nr:VOC family protein [Kaistia soli]SHE82552.1 hypothetical protein SAMN02745157_1021 [Kaistia soli DSM 19436]